MSTMPRLLEILIGAEFKDDGIVELLRDSIHECGCVSLATEAKRRGVSAESVRAIFSSMSGVTCDEEKCCITDITVFSANMKKLAGGE